MRCCLAVTLLLIASACVAVPRGLTVRPATAHATLSDTERRELWDAAVKVFVTHGYRLSELSRDAGYLWADASGREVCTASQCQPLSPVQFYVSTDGDIRLDLRGARSVHFAEAGSIPDQDRVDALAKWFSTRLEYEEHALLREILGQPAKPLPPGFDETDPPPAPASSPDVPGWQKAPRL